MSVPVFKAGSEVFIRVKTYDNTQSPPALYTPANGVKLTVTDPNGSIVVNDQTMTNISTGTYTYRFQTSGGSPLGIWTAFAKSTDGTAIVIMPALVAFQLL